MVASPVPGTVAPSMMERASTTESVGNAIAEMSWNRSLTDRFKQSDSKFSPNYLIEQCFHSGFGLS